MINYLFNASSIKGVTFITNTDSLLYNLNIHKSTSAYSKNILLKIH